MQVDDRRGDDTFDRELRQALAGRGGAASGPHLDAELAAAWMDGQLDAAATRSIDAHLTDCSDCQALIATLAQLTPEARATGVTWWRRIRAGWLIPATAAAAAGLVIWVVLPQQRPSPPPPSALREASAERAPAENQPDQAFERSAATALQKDARVPSTLQAELERLAKSKDKTPSPAAAPAPEPAAPAATPTAAPPAAPAQATPEAKAEAADKLSITAEGGAAREERSDQQRRSFNETIATARRGALATLRQGGPVLWVASDGAARWRTAGTQIEFAPGSDARFVTASLPVGADTLADASAPGGTVCWIVGRGGTVLVTADGVRFTRTSAPTPANLVSVTATDARTAVVTAEDGRRFRTADQGASWTPLP